jgi:putative ABC transport system permease protein
MRMSLQDIRLAVRLFLRTPVPSGIALLSIALSVGATAVVFAAIKSVLIDPLPYARPRELVQLRSEYPRMQEQSHADWVVWNDVRELARRTRTLGPIGVYRNAIFDLGGDAGTPPEALYGLLVTANLFPVLGVTPMLGRNILPQEDQPGHSDVMILSYGLWVRRFHSDRGVIGRGVTENGHQCLVIGVMPPGFNFPMRRAAVHTPSPYVEFWAAPFVVPSNKEAGLGAAARLRPGVSLQQARQDLTAISAALSHDFPETNRDRIVTANLVRDRVVGNAPKSLSLLMAAALVFMLIGCTNVANLLLARGFARRREMAIRLALGAHPGRIVRQLLTESSLLAALGGLGGYFLAVAAWQVLPALAPVTIPRLAAARADTAVFGFALALAFLNGILFGIAPALRLANWKHAIDPSSFGARGSASARHDRLRSSLVAAEVALAVVLVLAGGQLLGSFVRLIGTDPGFQADRVLASVILPAVERYPKPAQRALFYRRILDSVGALAGVEDAGTVDALPFSGENHGGYVSAGEGASPFVAEIDVVGGHYLQAMGVHLLEGRWFREEEMNEASDTAIISDFTARRLWPEGGAIGRRVCVDCTPEHPNNWKRVAGVVTNTEHAALNEPVKGNVYLSAGAMQNAVFLVVRMATASLAAQRDLENAIRQTVAAIDPNQPVFLSAPMQSLIADSVADRRFILSLLVITGCLALLMSAAGVHGVISYTTSRRTQEIGIRMALGATARNVHALIFRQGFAAVVIGLIIGFCAALPLMRFLQSVTAGFQSRNAAYLAVATILVILTGGIACWIPARRATSIDPMGTLREE